MATTLAEQINADEAARRDGAAKLYRELLGRADNPRPGDFEAMRDAMGTLGVDGEQMAADLKALAAARSLRDQHTSEGRLREMLEEVARLESAACDEMRARAVGIIEGLEAPALVSLLKGVGGIVCGPTTDWGDKVLHPSRLARLEIEAAGNRNREIQQRLADLASAHPLAFGVEPGANPTPAPSFVPRPKPATRRLAYTVPVSVPAR